MLFFHIFSNPALCSDIFAWIILSSYVHIFPKVSHLYFLILHYFLTVFNRYSAPGPYMGSFRADDRTLDTKLTKSQGQQQNWHWHSGAPHGAVNLGPVFQTETPGIICLIGWCAD